MLLLRSRMLVFAPFLLCCAGAVAQPVYTQDYFRLPIHIIPSLSGSFGEVRSNHFHSGIDFRTQGIEGIPVYASADGFVSRIRVSPVGFGKAIYVEHPNGYTTVYGHLRNFRPSIQQYIIKEQYKRESFDVDLNPEPGSIPVKKGEVIAWSGNSGSSGGPHLHYEIRSTENQIPLNPALFGLKITDNIAPVIQRLKIYPADNYSSINNKNKAMVFEVVATNGSFRLAVDTPVTLAGKIAFGLQFYDLHNASNLRLGIVKMEVFINSELVYSYNIDKFSFDETRYVNAVLDYEEWIINKRRFIQTRILPNNPLKVYKVTANKGLFDFSVPGNYKVQLVIADSWGNQAKLGFNASGSPASPEPLTASDTVDKKFFRYQQSNVYTSQKVDIEMPPLALYNDIWFAVSEKGPDTKTNSAVFQVHQTHVPVQLAYSLKIKPLYIPEKLWTKAIIARKDENNEWVSEGGKVENGWIASTTRSFGEFSIILDTIAPAITPLNIHQNKDISKQRNISIKIKDNFSGIRNYRGTLNGKWILMDYDPKNELLVYTFDDRLKKGENKFVLTAGDNAGNTSRYEAMLIKL